MSHKASHWLATIPAEIINAGSFRVLFHLCDAHNSMRSPETACFPSQEALRRATGLSNGGLNNALNALEDAGLLRRRRTRNDDGTKGRTYYILGCDGGMTQEPTPENGVGTISSLGPPPSPVCGLHHLQSTGDKPVIEPLKEPVSARGRDDLFSEDEKPENPNETFEFFWKAYPKKAGKPAARNAWDKAIKSHNPSEIIEGARRYAAWLANAPPGEFRPNAKHPQGWLNSERWKDEEIWQGQGGPSWDSLTDSQRRMLERKQCPPSMQNPDGTPNDAARALMAEIA